MSGVAALRAQPGLSLSQRDEIRQTKRDLAIVGNESFGFLATLVTSRQGYSVRFAVGKNTQFNHRQE
jgi:hypothetical protein